MDDQTPDELFAAAVKSYVKRDPRPLGKFVLTNDLSTEQRDFVAKALCGDIEQVDGRTVKPITRAIMSAYDNLKMQLFVLDMIESGHPKRNITKIASIIADHLGYDDVDTVRRAINRQKAKRMTSPITKMRVMKKVGHEKK